MPSLVAIARYQILPQAIFAAVRLGVFNVLLDHKSASFEEISRAAEIPKAKRGKLRALLNVLIRSNFLSFRSDKFGIHPAALKDITDSAALAYLAWRCEANAFITNAPGVLRGKSLSIYGTSLYSHLAHHPADYDSFQEAMTFLIKRLRLGVVRGMRRVATEQCLSGCLKRFRISK
jgi:hypothetical protein